MEEEREYVDEEEMLRALEEEIKPDELFTPDVEPILIEVPNTNGECWFKVRKLNAVEMREYQGLMYRAKMGGRGEGYELELDQLRGYLYLCKKCIVDFRLRQGDKEVVFSKNEKENEAVYRSLSAPVSSWLELKLRLINGLVVRRKK